MISLPKNKFIRWYWILSIIWMVFWFLDIFFLIPTSPMEEIRNFFTDKDAFFIYWFFIFIPVYIYLVGWVIYKLLSLFAGIGKNGGAQNSKLS